MVFVPCLVHLLLTFRTCIKAAGRLHRDLEILLHPRVPPLVRSATGFDFQSLATTNEVQDDAGNTVMDTSHEEVAPQDPSTTDSVVGAHSSHSNSVQNHSMWKPDHVQLAPPDDSRSPQSSPVVLGRTSDAPSTFSRTGELHLPSIVTPRPVLIPAQPVPSSPKMNVTVAGDDEDEDEPMPSIDVESDSD